MRCPRCSATQSRLAECWQECTLPCGCRPSHRKVDDVTRREKRTRSRLPSACRGGAPRVTAFLLFARACDQQVMTEMRAQAPGFSHGVERVRGAAPTLSHQIRKVKL